MSLNPLESGHAFRERKVAAYASQDRLQVLIPSNRVMHSEVVEDKIEELLDKSLNPLESGHAFRAWKVRFGKVPRTQS